MQSERKCQLQIQVRTLKLIQMFHSYEMF